MVRRDVGNIFTFSSAPHVYLSICLVLSVKIVAVQKPLPSLQLSFGCLGQYLFIRLGASMRARRYRPLEVATLVSVRVGGEMLP